MITFCFISASLGTESASLIDNEIRNGLSDDDQHQTEKRSFPPIQLLSFGNWISIDVSAPRAVRCADFVITPEIIRFALAECAERSGSFPKNGKIYLSINRRRRRRMHQIGSAAQCSLLIERSSTCSF